jgi:thiamine-phosphate pyrophosphorylase
MQSFRHWLVYTDHHQLALELGINRIHFTEKKQSRSLMWRMKNWKWIYTSTSIYKCPIWRLSSVWLRIFGPVFEVFQTQYVHKSWFQQKN